MQEWSAYPLGRRPAECLSYIANCLEQSDRADYSLAFRSCAVAALNGAAYEWLSHLPPAREAGLTEEQIVWIRDISNVRSSTSENRPQPPAFFSAVSKAALQYTDCVTVDIRVPAAVFAALKEHVNEQEVVEVTATIASYNMVSRILADRSFEEF